MAQRQVYAQNSCCEFVSAMKIYGTPLNTLELDLPAHEHLLNVLGKFYGDIYLSQNNRPKGMEYLDYPCQVPCSIALQKIPVELTQDWYQKAIFQQFSAPTMP